MNNVKYILINLLVFVALLVLFRTMPVQDWKRALGFKDKVSAVKINPLSFDFGIVPMNKPVAKDFRIKNIGQYDLIINNIEKECHCVTDSLEKKVVAPGKITSIKIGYDASLEGFFQKVVSIKMNIPEEYVTVVIKGTVVKAATIK